MSTTTIGTIRTLLESVLDAVADDEQRYRLRTALQLLDALAKHETNARVALSTAELDDELSATLTDLGYLG
ncbi:MAG: hypothetical protein U5J98_00720 [Halobacteriales archaeon]|nr:hypothetical protein [Halobacteriales archaeon]